MVQEEGLREQNESVEMSFSNGSPERKVQAANPWIENVDRRKCRVPSVLLEAEGRADATITRASAPLRGSVPTHSCWAPHFR